MKQRLFEQPLMFADAAGDDPEQEIELAGHRKTSDDLGASARGRLEGLRPGWAVASDLLGQNSRLKYAGIKCHSSYCILTVERAARFENLIILPDGDRGAHRAFASHGGRTIFAVKSGVELSQQR
jgi:hypothetical protein